MFNFRTFTKFTSRTFVNGDLMKKKKKHIIDIYMGGERDPDNVIVPEDLGKFFDKKTLLTVFIVLLILLLVAGVGL